MWNNSRTHFKNKGITYLLVKLDVVATKKENENTK